MSKIMPAAFSHLIGALRGLKKTALARKQKLRHASLDYYSGDIMSDKKGNRAFAEKFRGEE